MCAITACVRVKQVCAITACVRVKQVCAITACVRVKQVCAITACVRVKHRSCHILSKNFNISDPVLTETKTPTVNVDIKNIC